MRIGIASPFFKVAWEQPVGPAQTAGVSFSQFDGAGPVFEALRSNAVDVGFGSDFSAIASQASGASFKIFAIAKPNPQWLRLIVPEGSTTQNLTDLRGHSIAVVKGSAAHRFLVTQIQAAGLQPDDFSIKFLATADAQAAFRNGSVDAWAAWEPNAAQLETGSGARLIQTATQQTAGNIYFAANEEIFASDNPKSGRIIEFLRTFIAKLDALKGDPGTWATALGQAFKLSPPAAAQYARNYTFTFVPVDDSAELDYERAASDLKSLGVIGAVPSAAEQFTTVANSALPVAPAEPSPVG